VAVYDLADIPARLEINLGCGAGASVDLVARELRSLFLRGIGSYSLHQSLDNPPVIGRKKYIQDVGRGNGVYFLP